MSSGAPPGPVGSGRPVIVTEGLLDSREQVTRAGSDVESRPSEVQSAVAISGSVLGGKKSVAVVSKSVGRPKSVSMERFEKLETSVDRMFASMESFMSRFDQASSQSNSSAPQTSWLEARPNFVVRLCVVPVTVVLTAFPIHVRRVVVMPRAV